MRYLPHTSEDIAEMLQVVGAKSLDDLFSEAPDELRLKKRLNLPGPMSEWELNSHMDALAGRMAVSPDYKVFLGGGRYDHHIPALVPYLLGRSEFATAYTPYQPEISQGTLQGIYEFQTLCTRIFGMDIATASHYDGATALAEALLIAIRKTRRKKVLVSRLINPLFRQVIDTYFRPTDYEVVELPYGKDGTTDINALDGLDECAAVAVQSPNFFGAIENLKKFSDAAHAHGALSIVSFTEPLAYGLVHNPGSQGADIVAGEGQSFGVPMSFGGPGLGILASTTDYMRSLPGRLVGTTVDTDGERGFVLTLSTREQHIRREKATSNICSNNGLCAMAAVMYLASLGGTGLRRLAAINHDKAEYLKGALAEAGVRIPFSGPCFNEFVVDFGENAGEIVKKLEAKKIIPGCALERYFPDMKGRYLVCVTETKEKKDMDAFVKGVRS